MNRIASRAVPLLLAPALALVLALVGVGLPVPAVAGAGATEVVARPGIATRTTVKKPKNVPGVGGTVTIRGKKSKASRKIVIQQRVGGRWVKVAKVSTKKRKFKARVVLGQRVITVRALAKKRSTNGRTYRRSTSSAIQVWAAEDPTVVAAVAAAARDYINERRATVGITKAFVDNGCLSAFANRHSRAMVERDSFRHSNDPYWNGAPSFVNTCRPEAPGNRGEVIAMVYGDTPARAARAAVDAWINSPPHREIIEHSSGSGYQLGIGVFRSSDGAWWFTGVIAFS